MAGRNLFYELIRTSTLLFNDRKALKL